MICRVVFLRAGTRVLPRIDSSGNDNPREGSVISQEFILNSNSVMFQMIRDLDITYWADLRVSSIHPIGCAFPRLAAAPPPNPSSGPWIVTNSVQEKNNSHETSCFACLKHSSCPLETIRLSRYDFATGFSVQER